MSLDVYLNSKNEIDASCTCSECGHMHTYKHKPTLFQANITHNLNVMAEKAAIYNHLWRPEEIGIYLAKDLIEPLEIGLRTLKESPNEFIKYNSSNGYGTYMGLVSFVHEYLEACKEYPEAEIEVSR